MKKMTLMAGILAMILVFGIMVGGCVSTPKAPSSFVSGSGSSGDTTILLRQGLSFDQAFREIIFVLNRNGFEPEMMQPEVGYIRTRWNASWVRSSTSSEHYRVRVIINFNPGRTQIILQAPAEFSIDGGRWQTGYDSRAVETLRNDITQIVGN